MDPVQHVDDRPDGSVPDPGARAEDVHDGVAEVAASDDSHLAGMLVGLGTTTPLDGVAALAADLIGVEMAMVGILGSSHEFLLGTNGAVGVPTDGSPENGADAPEAGSPRTDAHPSMPLQGSMCEAVRERGTTVTVDDVAGDPHYDDVRTRLGVRACAGAPIHDGDGEIIGAVCVGSLTPREWQDGDRQALESLARFAERELTRAVDVVAMLERAEELALMVARLRHELSGDLTVVLGGIETALHPSASDDIRIRALSNARNDALRVIDVMDALLRTDARTSIRRRPVTLPSIVRDATRPVDDVNRRRVHVDCDDTEVNVAGRLLTRVLANLVDNALKHTPGDVRVTARADGSLVRITVQDEGPGFLPATLARLYKPFTSARNPDDDRGFGLGLYIVRELVDRLDGEIEVTSGGDGATIVVEVPAPLYDPDAAPLDPVEEQIDPLTVQLDPETVQLDPIEERVER